MELKSQSQRIAYALRESHIKQIDLARLAGVSRSAASQWVNGEIIKVSAENIFAIADATGFSARWLALGEGPPRNHSTEERANKLLTLYQRLDERGQAAVFRVAESESTYAVAVIDKG